MTSIIKKNIYHQDGIINIRYKIQGLPINKLDEEHVIQESKYFDFLKKQKVFRHLRRSNQCKTGIELCKNHREKIYPELLVAISHDMFQAIEYIYISKTIYI